MHAINPLSLACALAGFLAAFPARAEDPAYTHDPLAAAFEAELAEAYPAAATAAAAPMPIAAAAGAAEAASGEPPAEPAPSAAALLPDRLGPVEWLLWGRRGLMRGIGFPLTEEKRETELGLRRGMLTAHQIGGFLTLALMATTVVHGQMILNTDYEREPVDDDLLDRKVLFAKLTIASYFTTAALALLSPPPMIQRKQFSTLSMHKLLGMGHFTTMCIMPFLGGAIEGDYNKATYHQVVGYSTLALLAGAMVVITF